MYKCYNYFLFADINDNPPKNIAPVTIEISENIQINAKIASFTAIDEDAGDNGKIIYSITKQNWADEQEGDLFRIQNEKDLYVNGYLHSHKSNGNGRQSPEEYNILLEAKNVNVNPPKTSSAKITISTYLKLIN